MFDRIHRSFSIARQSFAIMREAPQTLLFIALSAVTSMAFMIALLVPTLATELIGDQFGILEGLVAFVAYFGLAFIATFFNVALTYTVRARYEHQNAGVGEALRFAFSRLPQIAGWSLISASVGLLLARLEMIADRAPGALGWILRAVRGAIGFSWSVVTLFVVPAMVYDNVGPIDAIKTSATTLKRVWGEALVRHFGFGFLGFLLSLPGFALILLSGPAVTVSGILGGFVVLAAVVWFLLVALTLQALRAIFDAALYHYTRHGEVDGFRPELMRDAIAG